MKITKYGHACLLLEQNGSRLYIDPSEFTDSIGTADGVEAIVFTHEHSDHFSIARLESILTASPHAKIIAPLDLADKLKGYSNLVPITDDCALELKEFSLNILSGEHAVIHPDFPRCHNLGVVVGNELYYPGDSLRVPADLDINILATPLSGPWLQMGEVMDFVGAIKPLHVLATHDGLLSQRGIASHTRWLGLMCEKLGVKMTILNTGEYIET